MIKVERGWRILKALHMVANVLLWVGGINLGLTALGFNVVGMVLGSMPMLETWFNILVGVSAVYVLLKHMGDCKVCAKS